MPVFRIYLKPVVEYEGDPPFFFDVLLDPDGNAVARQPIFGVCGDFSRTTAFWPVVLFPEIGRVDFGEMLQGRPSERYAITDLLKKKIELGQSVSIRSEQYGEQDVGDVSEIVALLDQVTTSVASVIADGAYDGETVYDAVTDRHPEADIVIPPRATAVPSASGATQRNQHIAAIEKHGRIGWQCRSGYNRRSLIETAMYRY